MTNITSHETTAAPVLLQAGEGPHVLQFRACVTTKLPVEASEGGRVSAAEFYLPPQFGPPLHVHHGEDEVLQILEGTVRVVCGTHDTVLDAGGFAYLPRGEAHTFWVEGDRPARMLAVFTPGGVERLFTTTGTRERPRTTAHSRHPSGRRLRSAHGDLPGRARGPADRAARDHGPRSVMSTKPTPPQPQR